MPGVARVYDDEIDVADVCDSVRLLNSIQNKPTSYHKPLIGVPCTPSSISSDSNGSDIAAPGKTVREVPAISKNRVGRHPEVALK
jgi:hypothetical protein